MNTCILAALGLAAGLALVASHADAHAKLVGAMPSANAKVAAPKDVVLHFSEELAPKLSGFDLMKADGAAIPVKTTVSKDKKTVTGAVPAPLAAGSYMVMWHAVAADDGHRTKGDFNFSVQ